MAVTRRAFLAGAAGAGVGFGLGAVSHQFPLASPQIGPDWRPGKETFVNSTCVLCPSHCGVRGRLVDGVLSRIDGNPLHPVSRGGLCPKGRAGLQLLYHPGRLTGPVERIGPPGSSDFRPISWDAALDRVGAALGAARDAGAASSVEWLVGDVGGALGELVRGFGDAYGSTRVFFDDYRDGSDEVVRHCQGIAASPAYDLANSDLVLSFGAGLAEAWSGQAHAARARDHERGRGPRWVQVDVRHSRTAARADQWIAVRPGTYGTLALGLAYALLKEGMYDVEVVAHRVRGWEDWTDESGQEHLGFKRLVLRHGRPDEVSARTGVAVDELIGLAKAFGTARRPLALWDQAVACRAGGLADALAIHALNILVGALNRPGGVVQQAPLPLPPLFADAPQTTPRSACEWPSAPGGDAGGPAEVLFLYQANPVASAANGAEVRGALQRVPLVVSFSPFLDESARFAHLILPDHTYLERWQDAVAPATAPYPVWGVVQPMVAPRHDTRATGDVILQLAKQLGGEVAAACPWPSVEKIVAERGKTLAGAHGGSAFVSDFQRHELGELEARGWWVPHRQSKSRFWRTVREAGGWFDPRFSYHDRSAASQHPGGDIWIFPAPARERLRAANLPLVEGFLPIETAARQIDQEYPLSLMPFRVMTLASGGVALMPWLLEHLGVLTGDAWGGWIEMNPATGHELGLTAGQRVRVESAYGAFEATLRLFHGAQPGVVNAPYGLHTAVEGWGQPRVANPLAAVGQTVDPASGLPDWYSTQVRIVATRGG